jgi:hypothetical protein
MSFKFKLPKMDEQRSKHPHPARSHCAMDMQDARKRSRRSREERDGAHPEIGRSAAQSKLLDCGNTSDVLSSAVLAQLT